MPETPPSAAAAPPSLFGYQAGDLNPDLTPMTRWTTWAAAQEAAPLPEALTRRLAYLATQDQDYQLSQVNDQINATPYVRDGEAWKPTAEFLAKGGECASYALAKYSALRALGWPAEGLHVTVIVSPDIGQHAVLAVEHNGQTKVLDNVNPEILPDTEVKGYTPVYSISDAGWRLYRPGVSPATSRSSQS